MSTRLVLLVLLVAVSGCDGEVIATMRTPRTEVPDPGVPTPWAASGGGTGAGGGAATVRPVVVTAVRRLSRAEAEATLSALLGVPVGAASQRLPEDRVTVENPFDNDRTGQSASESSLAEAHESLVRDLVTPLFAPGASAGVVARLGGCTPAGAEDAACLETLIRTFGRRALRRPVTEAEVAALLPVGALGKDAGRFELAAQAVVSALLTHPEFLLRVEAGDPATGTLTPLEVASKLAFAATGAGPDDWLLDLAVSGNLATRAQRRAAVDRLLADPRATRQLRRFHAQWLGYAGLGAAAQPFLDESNALVDDVVGQRKDHLSLLTSSRTFVSAALARHYGLPAPAAADGGWVDYPAGQRGGILSHGAFLSVQPSGGEASPTHRGRWVMTRFLCRGIGAAPGNVKVTPPPAGTCRRTYLTELHASGGCQSCHAQMDPIGFGLERFALDGTERGAEASAPACGLSGAGELPGLGSFSGPRGLGALLASTPDVERCVARHALRAAEGRLEDVAADAPALDGALAAYRASHRDLKALLTELWTQDEFISRKDAP